MLRSEGEEDDFAFAVGRLGEGDFAVYKFFAEHPAGEQSVFFCIFCDGFDVARPG